MALSLLITGTDTEVGKTFVGVGLITAFTRLGFRVAPFKPVETGCLRDTASGTLIPADARLLESASGTSSPLKTICPYQYSMPVAPWVAAERERKPIDLRVLDECFETLKGTHDLVLIESAGGLLVPLSLETNFADLARRWNVPVLIVAGSRLGVLNQTLLTIRYLESAKLKIAGCILNHPFGDHKSTSLAPIQLPALESNSSALGKLVPCPLWEVPFRDNQSEDESERAFVQIADELLSRLRS